MCLDFPTALTPTAPLQHMHWGVQIRQAFLQLTPEPGDEDGLSYHDVEKLRRASQRVDFPGSQPVSLSSSNQDLIYKHRCAGCCYGENLCLSTLQMFPSPVRDMLRQHRKHACVNTKWKTEPTDIENQHELWLRGEIPVYAVHRYQERQRMALPFEVPVRMQRERESRE